MTDPVTVSLGDNIALIAVAAMFGIEAFKASDRTPRAILTVIAVGFALSGLFLETLAKNVPDVGTVVSEMFDDPSSWFIMFMTLFFVARPFWADKNLQIIAPVTAEIPVKTTRVIYTYARQTGNGHGEPFIYKTGLLIVPNQNLSNVKIYWKHAIMASGWGQQPPHWGNLSERELIFEDSKIQRGDEREISLMERGKAHEEPVVLANHDFGKPDPQCWPYRRIEIELVSDEYSETHVFALFMPGHSITMLIDVDDVPIGPETWVGPITRNEPRYSLLKGDD